MHIEIRRFPRTQNSDVFFLAHIRKKYPPPPYNWHCDGGFDPAEYILSSVVTWDRKKLKKMCRKHSLEPSGSNRKMMKRLYLHWRAKKLRLGKEYFGYGPGYENTRKPDCVCGYENVKEFKAKEKQKDMLNEMRKTQRRKAFEKPIRRFPRYTYPRRFPRR